MNSPGAIGRGPWFRAGWLALLGWGITGCLPSPDYVPPANFAALARDAEIGIIPTIVTDEDGERHTVLTTADGQYIGTYPYNTGQFGQCSYAPNGCWSSCCAVHDILYTDGGSEADREFADLYLRDCINEHGGPGGVYYLGVRLFGWLAFHYTP